MQHSRQRAFSAAPGELPAIGQPQDGSDIFVFLTLDLNTGAIRDKFATPETKSAPALY